MKAQQLLSFMVEQEHNAIEKLLDNMDESYLTLPLTSDDQEMTIGKRLAHMIEAEYRMATYLIQTEDDLDEFKVDATSMDDIRSKLDISKSRHTYTMENLSPDDFDKIWTSKVSGNSYGYKFLLWHFLEHLSTHRGQIAMRVNRLKDKN